VRIVGDCAGRFDPVTAEHRTATATHWGVYDVVSRDGRIVSIEPSPRDPDPSAIGPGMISALGDATRVLRPAVRRGWLDGVERTGSRRRGADTFVEVSWDTALDLVAGELTRVRSDHGPQAIYGGSYGWGSAGRFHHAQSQVHRFLGQGGGYTDSRNTYSTAVLEVLLPHVIGGHPWSYKTRMPTWEEVARDGGLVVAFGGMPLKNSQVNPGGVAEHEVRALQLRCREAGVEFVNIGPIRGDAAAFLEAEWISPRPNTDTAIMLGIAHTLVVNELHDREFLDCCCTGFDRFAAYLLGESDGVPKDARWAGAIADLEPRVIEDLAGRIAARRTLITMSYSLQRAGHGEQPCWMAVVLAAMSGSMGRPGGGWGAGYGAMAANATYRDRPGVAALPQPSNPCDRFIPVARITDALLHPGAVVDYDGRRLELPDLRLIYWCGGNPFHHQQDLNRLANAWQRPETVVVHEAWWNANARFADVVLPVATMLERNDFAAGMGDPRLTAMQKASEAPGEARTDYQVFCALADRLGYGSAFSEGRTDDEWIRHLYARTRDELDRAGIEIPPFAEFWRTGHAELPPAPGPFPGSFEALREDPERFPLATPSGRIEIFSETIDGFGYDDCPGHPAWLAPAEWLGSPKAARWPLHLVSNQPVTRLHSQYDNGGCSRSAKIAGREPVTLHPDDAAARGIADGDLVRVFNERGGCLAGARLSAGIRPGVLQLATGAWWDPVDVGSRGALDRHGNPNAFTLDRGTSRLAQGPSAQTTLVEVERFDGPAPPVRAFAPPEGGEDS
jgi:biotin/methionine sulfoxide reductase